MTTVEQEIIARLDRIEAMLKDMATIGHRPSLLDNQPRSVVDMIIGGPEALIALNKKNRLKRPRRKAAK